MQIATFAHVPMMSRYDVYSFCPESGLLVHWQKFQAASDEDARHRALAFGFPPPMELWKGEVLLNRWEERANRRGWPAF